MSNPSFSNIDLWLFELAEGNLSPEQVEKLELFLLNHPELDVDRDMWEMAKVDKTPVAYPDMASLERKRRPVAAFAFAGVFLFLLIGSGAYMTLNNESTELSEEELLAQNAQVKAQLFDQIRTLQEQSNHQTPTMNASNVGAFEKLTLNKIRENASGTYDSSNEFQANGSRSLPTLLAAEINTQPGVENLGNQASEHNGVTNHSTTGNLLDPANLELAHSASSQLNQTEEGVTNPQDQSYESEVNDVLGNSEEVGEKDFYVRKPSVIDASEGRIWTQRQPSWSVRTSSTSNDDYHKSFKDRFNQFTRSLERMMNAPIALKNSRDPHYLIPGMNASDVNFSSAGTLISTRVQTMSRLQWQGQENEQLMNQISADGYSYGIRGGWGVQMNHQWYNNGGIQVGQVAFTYSPKISVSNWFSVEPSVRMKMGNKRLDADVMKDIDVVEIERGNARDFYSDGTQPIGRSLWYKDLGFGMLVNTKWFFAGVQVDNVFRYKDNLYNNNWSDPRRAQNHFTATLGSDWVSRNEKMTLSPYAVYQKNENLSELWVGANYSFKWFNIGVAASTNLEPAASIGMKFEHFSLHYNADYTQSSMLDKKALSHQVTLRFLANSSTVNKRVFKR